MQNSWDQEGADAIVRLGMGYRASHALLSAIEIGVFTELADHEIEGEILIGRLELHPRGARDFLDTLVALKLLKREGTRYANTPAAGIYLDCTKPSYIGGLFEPENGRMHADWDSLTAALRSGRPRSASAEPNAHPYAPLHDPAKLEIFLSAISGANWHAAHALAERFPWGDYRQFVDIGAGQGALCSSIASAHEHLSGGGFDFPEARPSFERHVARQSLSHRLRFYPGFLLEDPLPPADVLVFGDLLCHWNLDQKKLLLGKAYHALTDEGALIVHGTLIDDDRKDNITGLLDSLAMLLHTPGGFEFTGVECSAWMAEVGFRETSVQRLTESEFMIVGIK